MKLLIATLLASSGAASTASQVFSTTSSSLLRTQSRSFITSHISQTRNLQTYKAYTPEQCTTLLAEMTAFDADATGGLNREEYYSFLKALDSELGTTQTKDSSSFYELHAVPQIIHTSLACYCKVLGGDENCCVGADAEVPLAPLTNEEKVASGEAEEYANEVCETVYWTMLEWDEDGATGTGSTVGGETTVAATGTTVAAGSTEAAGGETTEAAGTTGAAETTEAAGTTGAAETTESSEATTVTTEAAVETTESSLVTVAPEGTTTEAASDDVTTEAASDDVTTEAASDDVTETGTTAAASELPVTTTPAPLVSDDGTMTFTTVTTTIDFTSYDDLPDEYDSSDYYNATEVLENAEDNAILIDMQQGFVGLALDVLDVMYDGHSDDTTPSTEAASDDTPSTEAATDATGTVAVESKRSSGRSLAHIDFFEQGDLTTDVEDIACPAGLAYAPEGAPCLTFTYTIIPPADSFSSIDELSTFATSLDESINSGKLFSKVVEINPKTFVTGSGEPGSGTYDINSPTVDSSESEDSPASKGGLSIEAITGIFIAVLMPIAW